MKMRFEHKIFQFKRPAGTSRGILTEKHAWFIELWDENNPNVVGIGECSVIPGLSPDFTSIEDYEQQLVRLQNDLSIDLTEWPSILFGLETAKMSLAARGSNQLFDNSFAKGERAIPINGLIWMGDEKFMSEQIEQKLTEGFSTIKMKIGAIDFDTELKLLASIRNRFSAEEITLRVDANGAFQPTEALDKLNKLSDFDLHSIEQPIKQDQWEEMRKLCEQTPIPIALDEELIGINDQKEKIDLLETIQPQFIILKPSLHGGISGTKEWISLAEERNIPWWMTSALESNVGLNAIAQLAGEYENDLPQGLGTGSLYVENTPTDLVVENGTIFRKLGDK